MGFAEQTCVTIKCDGNCQHEGWSEDGPYHFDSREDAERYLRERCRWLIVGDRALCENCAARAECEATSHQYDDDWSPREIKGVRWRQRDCQRCDEVDYDPPYEQLKVLSDAARVIDAVQVDEGQP